MSKREIEALLLRIEDDAQDEPVERNSEEILDAAFDDMPTPWDAIDDLASHVRRRWAFEATLADAEEISL